MCIHHYNSSSSFAFFAVVCKRKEAYLWDNDLLQEKRCLVVSKANTDDYQMIIRVQKVYNSFWHLLDFGFLLPCFLQIL